MSARIYQRPKNAMQSGKALVGQWILDFAPAQARQADPLMGWAGSGDTQQQVVLKFESAEAAQAYAKEVVVADLDAAGGEGTVALIRTAGGEATFVRCNVTLENDVQQLMDEVIKKQLVALI